LEISHKLLVMKLADSQEVEYFLIQIVKDFNARRLFVKKDLSAAAERFDISGVLGDKRNNLLGDSVLTA
jgi:hypothetical protein